MKGEAMFDEMMSKLSAELEKNPREFRPYAWYNKAGNSIFAHTVDEADVEHWIDHGLYLFVSYVDERPIGFQVAGVSQLIKLCNVSTIREIIDVGIRKRLKQLKQSGCERVKPQTFEQFESVIRNLPEESLNQVITLE